MLAAMLPFFTEQFGNPSSMHSFGNKVGFALKEARAPVQALPGAEHESEIISTPDQVAPPGLSEQPSAPRH